MREIRDAQNITNEGNESRKVTGYALVFNSESNDLGGFVEIINRTAITEETIKNSDVLCLLNHDKQRGVLARSNKGEGSLKLTIDEVGLKYEFEAPHTNLGDEILEGLRRKDISKCSFAFVCEEDRWVKSDGKVIRYIDKIKALYDVSLVYNPAYEDTFVVCDTRGMKELLEAEINKNIISEMEDKDEIRNEQEELAKEETTTTETDEETRKEDVVEDDKKDETEDEKQDDKEDVSEDSNDTEHNDDTEAEAEENEDEKRAVDEVNAEVKEIRNNNIENKNHSRMNKFNLIKTIRDLSENRQMDESAKSVVAEGRSAFNKAGLAASGQIVLGSYGEATTEERAAGILAQTATQGKENVPVDKYDILEPLYANLVLAKAGATMLTNCVGDISIPRYSGSQAFWKGETVAAGNGEGSWREVTLSPKRLTTAITVSKMFLAQDSNSAEEMLKRDIIAAISQKLESTFLSDGEGDATKPAGIFHGVAADTAAFSYQSVVDMEEALDSANVTGNFVYIASPKAKAIARTTKKDNGSGFMVMQNGEIEGIPVLTTSNVVSKGLALINGADVVVATWGGLDLVVDNVTLAAEGCIRLVINFYCDVKVRRDESVVKRILK